MGVLYRTVAIRMSSWAWQFQVSGLLAGDRCSVDARSLSRWRTRHRVQSFVLSLDAWTCTYISGVSRTKGKVMNHGSGQV
jgi:hypothetical protein